MDRRTKIGIAITVGYASVVLALTWPQIIYLGELKLNELGDFLAGVFGPVAVFWLIIGYFQQGVELKQNTEALKLQAEELHNAVKQYESLAQTSREALGHETRKARAMAAPLFVIINSKYSFQGDKHGGAIRVAFSLRNKGNLATEIRFRALDNLVPELERECLPVLRPGQEKSISFLLPAFADVPLKLESTCLDGTGRIRKFAFQLKFPAIKRASGWVPIDATDPVEVQQAQEGSASPAS